MRYIFNIKITEIKNYYGSKSKTDGNGDGIVRQVETNR